MRLGVLLGEAGRSADALIEEQHAVASLSEGLGPLAPDTLAAKGNLSGTLRGLGKLAEALELAREVQKGWNDTEGENSARARWSLRHVAMMEQANGNYETALGHIEHLLNTDGPTVDWADPDQDRLVQLGAKGALLYHLGRTEDAASVQQESLSRLLARLPDEDIRVQAARNNLAVTLNELGRSEEALDLIGEVVASRLKTMPAEHPDVLSTRGNMVAFLSELGRYDEALALSEELLLGYESTFGQSHPEYARALGSVAACLRQVSRNSEAIPVLTDAVEIAEQSMPPEHPELARLRRNLERAQAEL
jgi:tetratricopeptide (TPR) repeat protein